MRVSFMINNMAKQHKTHIAAPPGEVYWRREKCPHGGSKVLLLTTHGICVTGSWYGDYGQFFQAWSPMPKDCDPPPDIRQASLWDRIRFAFNMIFFKK